ncbi:MULTISPECIES: xanthine phosphoribosyltransferase [Acetobacter]|jgi:xanthine phosphoribosyltransferase|uniref:xanthine phosphoribosyltransferase n=1 Tax=Acetobacter TaxID=434 RepID=UPI00235665C8|nr:xanthine phosphoribosyltransferase [Acetobacter peroxydans]MCH4143127.1 xanthine phosphoribosyltransferase [Acetobacter peroxydans]MCI1395185.1 xanthine phosphoribosyltransferase [Acetobacter peroxydans]MCI1410673.1 xanthine phosphoribosyltransferase [Acetobacter peroxydans]MCI1440062.1 xanthine phosphoribosyltransferase [Acetobacter peroxydans]MCI1565945.1 xanthine phosphoribosyltransferase [Acetobacter peroxydans]
MATHYATVTWDQLHRDARTLARQLMPLMPFNGVVAITRGGMIPAAIIARELGCRVMETISVVSYEEEEQGDPMIIKQPEAAGDGEGFLVVDDLVDSGVTARLVRERLPKAVFACLYAKPKGRELTDYFVTEVSQDTWVLFPWDTAPLFVPPLVDGGRDGDTAA